MKKILYYSPFIPVIGFIVHLFWIIFRYEIYSIEEDEPKCYIPMALQTIYIGVIMIIIRF